MYKKILLTILIALSIPLFAKEVEVIFPKITVPDVTLPTKLVMKGELEFEDNWIYLLLGDDYLNKIQSKIFIGEVEIAIIKMINTNAETGLYEWSVTLDLLKFSPEIVKKIKNKEINIKIFYGAEVFWSWK